MCALDYATPLRIQTSPAHSSSSTDTSSEIGSAFNSPTQGKRELTTINRCIVCEWCKLRVPHKKLNRSGKSF